MARITKTIAADIAEQVCAPIWAEKEQAELEFITQVETWYKQQIPEEVLAFHKKHKTYLAHSNNVYLQSHGFSYTDVKLTESYPYVYRKNNSRMLDLDAKKGALLQKMQQKIEKLKEKYNNTYSEIEQALISLGTYKRVEVELPDIYPLLPGAPNSKALMLLGPVKTKIACLLSEDKKCLQTL